MDLARRAREIASILAALAHITPSGGGGGSSDFTTCTMTVHCEGWYPCDFPCIWGEGENAKIASTIGISEGSYTVVLYKGASQIFVNNVAEGNATFSGGVTDVEYYYDADTGDEGYDFTVTGDCTITIS